MALGNRKIEKDSEYNMDKIATGLVICGILKSKEKMTEMRDVKRNRGAECIIMPSTNSKSEDRTKM